MAWKFLVNILLDRLLKNKISSEKFLWRALLILTPKDDFENVKQRTAENIK